MHRLQSLVSSAESKDARSKPNAQIEQNLQSNTKKMGRAELLISHLTTPNIDQAMLLIRDGINPNVFSTHVYSDRGGYSPLTLAITYQRWEIVKELIPLGVDVNARDGQGRQPLGHAILRGAKKEILELLIDRGANLILDIDDFGTTSAFKYFPRDINIDHIDFLIENKALKFYFFDESHVTPAALAMSESRFDLAKLFLKKNSYLGTKKQINELLRVAAESGRKDVACLLLDEYKADVNCSDNYYSEAADVGHNTPLINAVKSGNQETVTCLVLQYKADLHAINQEGKTALTIAKETGNKTAVEFLEEALKSELPKSASVSQIGVFSVERAIPSASTITMSIRPQQ